MFMFISNIKYFIKTTYLCTLDQWNIYIICWGWGKHKSPGSHMMKQICEIRKSFYILHQHKKFLIYIFEKDFSRTQQGFNHVAYQTR